MSTAESKLGKREQLSGHLHITQPTRRGRAGGMKDRERVVRKREMEGEFTQERRKGRKSELEVDLKGFKEKLEAEMKGKESGQGERYLERV